MAYALYSQYVDYLDPCPLCIFQRVAFIWMGAFALLAALHNPAGWGRKMYAWLVFLGACLVYVNSGHLNFGLLTARLPFPWQGRLQRLIALSTALLCGYLTYQSWQVLSTLARIGQKSMASEIPMVVPHTAVLLSLAVITLCALYRALRPKPKVTL